CRWQGQGFHLRTASRASERKSQIDNLAGRNGRTNRARLERRGRNENRQFARRRGRTGACQRQARRRYPFFPGHVLLRHVQKLRRSRRPISRSRPGAPEMIMKLPKLLRRKRLRAATGRRPLRATAHAASEEMSE